MFADNGKDKETYAIIGAAMEVHGQLGSGFLEAVYQDAFELELQEREIPFTREHQIPISYKGRMLSTPYRADFLCHESVIVELKAVKELTDIDLVQLLHYLRATNHRRGLLLNFGAPRLEYKRLINSQEKNLRPSATSAVQ